MANFSKAREFLERMDLTIYLESGFYQTSPWGNSNQPDFINQAWLAKTRLNPQPLLVALKKAEIYSGRTCLTKWGQREMDIDILFFNSLTLSSPSLNIPHPHLHERRFVLEPLNELIPSFIHPVFKKAVNTLLNECQDKCTVKKLNLITTQKT